MDRQRGILSVAVGLETKTRPGRHLWRSSNLQTAPSNSHIKVIGQIMENGAPTQGEGKDPSGFLGEIIGNPVTVKLNSGVVYKGKCFVHSRPKHDF
jgi:hypothetical protein